MTRARVSMPSSDVAAEQPPVEEQQPALFEDSIPIHEADPDEEDDQEDDFQEYEVPPIMVEDMDPKEQLWPEGPTAGQIVQWKQQHDEVYVSSLTPEEHLVWRVLTREEWRMISRNTERVMASGKTSQTDANMDNEEIITELCLLFPKLTRDDFRGKKAGLPTSLSQDILQASGFSPIDVRLL